MDEQPPTAPAITPFLYFGIMEHMDKPQEGLPAKPPTTSRGTWILIAVVGIITLLIIAGMSAYGGYRSGMFQQQAASATLIAQQLQAQYDMALEDMANGRYDIARQRLEWIIKTQPDYPGVTDQLAEAIMRISITASPTVAPTSTATPTPDTRSIDELFAQAQQAMAAGDWTNAIENLLKLRKTTPEFHAIEIDGMLYISLRNRGVDKIKASDLEGGTYDLTLAERFGPLDTEAANWRDWAEMYITGASFWEVDWSQVINYFEQLVLIAPNLMDASGWTSTYRLYTGYARYGDLLAADGKWCEAQMYYVKALAIQTGEGLKPTARYAEDKCSSGQERKKRTPTPPPEQPSDTPEAPPETSTPTPPTSYP